LVGEASNGVLQSFDFVRSLIVKIAEMGNMPTSPVAQAGDDVAIVGFSGDGVRFSLSSRPLYLAVRRYTVGISGATRSQFANAMVSALAQPSTSFCWTGCAKD
jgi:hypothetical protein